MKSTELKIIADEKGSLFATLPDGRARNISVEIYHGTNYGVLTVGDLSDEIRTKADTVRNMTDEELAKLFDKIENEAKAYGCQGVEKWLDWLTQEDDNIESEN